MHGLRTSSVLVLDDTDDDALKVQKSLALLGIGAILIPGAPDEERPRCSLTGIRVAVLDIHLGFGTDSSGQVRYTRNIVDSLIDKENGPYVAVIWTSNPDDYDLFSEELKMINCPPVLTVKLEKNSVLDLDPKSCAGKILESISKAISEVPPLEFGNQWEQIVRDAATETIVSLKLAEPPQDKRSKALDYLATLLRSEADEQAMQDDANAMHALLTALNPVHFDKMGDRSARMSGEELSVVEPIRRHATASTANLSLSDRAQLNSALLFDRRSEGFGPGHLYGFHDIECIGIGPALPSEEEVRADTVATNHLERACDLPVVFLEVSASCDHQQGKIRTARLLAGVVFDASLFGKGTDRSQRISAGNGDYLHRVGPASIPRASDRSDAEVFIVWNAHYTISVSAASMSGRPTIGRFREPLVADIRAWLGYQAGRPGYASVD